MASQSASSANGLDQLMDSHVNDLISSHHLQAEEHTVPQQPEQPHQTVGQAYGSVAAAMEILITFSFRHSISGTTLHN